LLWNVEKGSSKVIDLVGSLCLSPGVPELKMVGCFSDGEGMSSEKFSFTLKTFQQPIPAIANCPYRLYPKEGM